jgi:hypothetical protein
VNPLDGIARILAKVSTLWGLAIVLACLSVLSSMATDAAAGHPGAPETIAAIIRNGSLIIGATLVWERITRPAPAPPAVSS